MNRFIIGIFFLFTLFAVAQTAPAGVAFTSETQTVAVGAISETITIQVQDASGSTFKLPNTGCLALSSSASGEFSSSASSWSSVSILTMNKNSANRNFFYKSNVAGAHTLTARLVLKPESEERSCANWPITEWPDSWSASQNMAVGAGGSDISTQNPPPSVPPPLEKEGGGGGFSEPVPFLLVKISGPSITTVGADATFSATVFGVKKEPIPNARVVWSFGNGAVKEGLSVRYGYNIPGSYLVMVDASSGGFAGSARLAVYAQTPNVRVSRIEAGVGGFVEIENRSNAELDVSGWGITSNGTLFTIPDHTIILSSAKVAFPSEVTKLSLTGNGARLLFPNGTLAAEYVPPPNPVNIPHPSGTPLKGGAIKNSSLEGGVRLRRTEDVSSATSTPAAIAFSVTDTSSNGDIGKWLWGVFGVCMVGVGVLAAFRFKPLPPEESEEKEFAEKVHIV